MTRPAEPHLPGAGALTVRQARHFAFIILLALTALALAVLGAPSSPEEVVPETALADVPAKPPVDLTALRGW